MTQAGVLLETAAATLGMRVPPPSTSRGRRRGFLPGLRQLGLRTDERLWSLFLSLRRLDRRACARSGRRYEFVLPGPIRR